MDKKTTKQRILLAKLAYLIVCNIPVCLCLCFASSLTSVTTFGDGVFTITYKDIVWINFLYNFLLSFFIAMCIGMFVPLTNIGRWFTKLFKVDNTTYTNNMPYRLLSTLIITCIYFIGISPLTSIFNVLILKTMTWQQSFLSWCINIPLMLIVGFVSSLISDVAAYRIAHSIDKTF